MNADERLAALESAWNDRSPRFADLLQATADEVSDLPPAPRASALRALTKGLASESHDFAARIGIMCGAVVEAGADPALLGEALLAPVERSLSAACRFVRLAELLPDSDDPDGIDLGRKRVARGGIDAIYADDADAVDAFFSLEIWYRPAVAAWTRAPGVLALAQQRAGIAGALAALGDASEGSYWLSILLGVSLDQPFAILFPELREGYALSIDGVSDTGQLAVLLADALRDPLRRIGAAVDVDPQVLAVMRGEGPQSGVSASYGADFHLYPWQAFDPETSMPAPDRFMWSAPGGTGTHSLPPDFQPSAIEPLGDRRVLFAVGPRSQVGMTFTRVIRATRTFEGLRARVASVRRLGADDVAALVERVRAAVSA